MDELVGQQADRAHVLAPVGEEVGRDRVLGRAVMLQADAAHLRGRGDQEVVAVIGAGAEQAVGLGDQVLEPGDLFRRRGDVLGLVGDDVQVDGLALRVDLDALEVGAAEQGAVDQGVEVGGAEGRHAVLIALGVQGHAVLPALGQADRGGEGDAGRAVAGGIEQGLLPLKIDHLGGHDDAPGRAVGLGQPLELDHDLTDALWHVDVEGVGVDGVAQPVDPALATGHGHARDQLDRAGGGVVAGQELGIEQDQRPGRDRDGLADADDLALHVGGVDLILDDAGVGFGGRGRDGRQGARQAQGRVLGRRRGRRLRAGPGLRSMSQSGRGDRGQQQGESGGGQASGHRVSRTQRSSGVRLGRRRQRRRGDRMSPSRSGVPSIRSNCG
ncbi:hypothetical protein D3C80_1051470 [compost metagenome]